MAWQPCVAMLLTFVAISTSWAGMTPVAGKPLTIGALLVLPLVIAAKCEWTVAASAVFAYFTYFVLSFAGMLVLMRKHEERDPVFNPRRIQKISAAQITIAASAYS